MFVRILIPALIAIIVGIVFSSIVKSNDKELIRNLTNEHIVIRSPKAYVWIGCIDISFFGGFLIWIACFSNKSEALWVWIGLAFFVLLGVVIVWVSIICRIDLFRHEDYFLMRTTFFRTHRIQYCDCISYKIGTNYLVLKTDKETLRIDLYATNVNFLMNMLKQHKVKEIR